MGHNVSLPTHRYVWVVPSFVLRDPAPAALIPAMWVGVSVTPSRSLGCHALVVDLPLHSLRGANAYHGPVELSDVVAWDCYGWKAEVWQPEALSGLMCTILSSDHKSQIGEGTMWFCVDHMADAYSMAPDQHKHLWVVARHADHALMLLPQDRLLIEELSFTAVNGIPPIKRQNLVWCAE